MQLSSLTKLALASVVAFAAGCGPQWIVVRQAAPNPMTPATPFFVADVSLEGLVVGNKSEAEWMSTKSAETRDKWAGDKVAMNEQFSEGFESGRHELARVAGPQGAFVVRAHFDRYEPGYNVGISASNGTIDATVDIFDPAGQPVDEFRVHAEAGGFSAGERARQSARVIGYTAARYLRKRVGL